MNRKWTNKFKLLFLLLAFAGCGKEVFVARTQNEKTNLSPSAVSSNLGCANFTKVKPPVDILFVVDNSGSANLMSANLKTAIQSTIYSVSQEFDYHIMVAPLISVGTDSSLPVVAASPVGLSVPTVPPEGITFFNTAVDGGSDEKGFLRVINLINNNRSNGVFRTGAYTLVVLISNGEDRDYVVNSACPQCPPTTDYFDTRYNTLVQYTKKYYDSVPNASLLRSPQFHFMSLVCHQTGVNCPGVSNRYKRMSRKMYDYIFNTSYESSGVVMNSYDISNNTDFSTLFAGVNASIQSIILEHKYDYWPVSTLNNFDRNSVVVKKNGVQLVKGDTDNGFTLFPDLMADPSAPAVTQNTRYEPTPGEPFTGYLVKLYGDARIKFNASTNKPDCLEVKTSAPKQWFGYFSVSRNPDMSTMVVKKNGTTIPLADMNLVGYQSNFNVQIACTENYDGSICTPANPNSYSATTSPGGGLMRSGYIIRVKSNWIFSSGDQISIDYKPASN